MACGAVDPRSWRELVLEHDGPAVVVFTAGFCEDSLKLLKTMNQLADAYEGRARLLNLDLGKTEAAARKNPIARQYKVNRLPVVMLFNEGRPLDLIGGVSSREDIVDMVDRQLRPVREVIGERNFQQEVLDSKLPVLVHFAAGSCDLSLDMGPIVEATAEKFQGRAKVVRVELNAFNANVMERYGAIRLPVIAAFEGGEMRDSILGPIVDGKQLASKNGKGAAVEHVSEMLEQFA